MLYSFEINMSNFYETLDDIFNEIIESDKAINTNDIVKIKGSIIKAYENTSNKESDYISNILSVKQFKINRNGIIEIK